MLTPNRTGNYGSKRISAGGEMTLSKNVAPAEDHRFLIYPRQLRSPILKVTELLSVAGATDGVSL